MQNKECWSVQTDFFYGYRCRQSLGWDLLVVFLNTKTHWRRPEWILKLSRKIRNGPLWFGGSNQLRSAGESLLKSFHRTFAVKSTLTAKSMHHQYVEWRRFISADSPVSRWLPSLILLPQFAVLMRCFVAALSRNTVRENTGAKRILTGINGMARSRLGPNVQETADEFCLFSW